MSDGDATPSGEDEKKKRPTYTPHHRDQYEECEVCDGLIDTFNANYYKSKNDEKFKHRLCYENGEPPEGYVYEATDTEKCCQNRQYNCGHMVFAPPREFPTFCPECNNLTRDGDEWVVGNNSG